MSLIKHHYRLLGQLFGHQISDLGVQQVVVAVHYYVSMQDLKTREKTGPDSNITTLFCNPVGYTFPVCSGLYCNVLSSVPDSTDTSPSSCQSLSGRQGCRCQQEEEPVGRLHQTPANTNQSEEKRLMTDTSPSHINESVWSFQAKTSTATCRSELDEVR